MDHHDNGLFLRYPVKIGHCGSHSLGQPITGHSVNSILRHLVRILDGSNASLERAVRIERSRNGILRHPVQIRYSTNDLLGFQSVSDKLTVVLV